MKTIPEEDRWLFQYTLPCTAGHPELFTRIKPRFIERLSGDLSRESIRKYFMTTHNQQCLDSGNWTHLVVPYKIINPEERIGKTNSSFPLKSLEIELSREQIETAIKFGVLPDEKLKPEETIYLHSRYIVDIGRE